MQVKVIESTKRRGRCYAYRPSDKASRWLPNTAVKWYASVCPTTFEELLIPEGLDEEATKKSTIAAILWFNSVSAMFLDLSI